MSLLYYFATTIKTFFASKFCLLFFLHSKEINPEENVPATD